MTCNRYQLELSQCLDGRLPGNRRAAVMVHVDTCPTCAQVWEEMQAAQSMVFGLKDHQVGNGFRDRVWERIHSGEGAPDVLLQEPITATTKIRYGLVGAAAAAAFLFGLHLLTRDVAPTGDAIAEANRLEVANIDAEKGDDKRVDQKEIANDAIEFGGPPAPNNQVSIQTEALMASQLASQTVNKVTTAAKRLRLRSPAILRHDQNAGQHFWTEVDDDVRTIDGGLSVLNTMEQKKLVEFEGNMRDCFIAARNTLDLHRTDPQLRTYNLVRTLGACSLDGLEDNIKVKYSVRQFQQPRGMFFELIADDQFRRIVTELKLVKGGGTVMFLQMGSGEMGALQLVPGMLLPPQQVTEPSAPAGSQPKRLRKRESK